MTPPSRDRADPLACAAVALLLGLPCLGIGWLWLRLSFGLELSGWLVPGGALLLALLAYRLPGRWLEKVWVFCVSLFFGTPVK